MRPSRRDGCFFDFRKEGCYHGYDTRILKSGFPFLPPSQREGDHEVVEGVC